MEQHRRGDVLPNQGRSDRLAVAHHDAAVRLSGERELPDPEQGERVGEHHEDGDCRERPERGLRILPDRSQDGREELHHLTR